MAEVPRNPYITGGPLGDPTGVGFYGRRDIYDFVQESLNSVQRNPILLHGQRRIGKTSILRQMPNYLPDDLVIVYFDLQGKALKPLDEVLFMLARKIRQHAAIKEHLIQVRAEEAAEHTFATDFLPRVFDVLERDKYRLLLLFDEMDVIDLEQIKDHPEIAAYTFREYMRTLMDVEQQVGYIFVVGRDPKDLDEAFIGQLFRGAVQKRIGHLSQAEMDRLVVEPAQSYLLYLPETRDAIHTLTDGHPFCTQLICQQLWSRHISSESQYPVTISPSDVEEAVPDALIYGTLGLNWIYDGLVEPAHRLFLSAAAEVGDGEGNAQLSDILDNLRQYRIGLAHPAVQTARRDLVNWGILERIRGEAYRFKVEMIRRWIASERSLEHMTDEARFISHRAYRLYELADEYRQDGQLEDAAENYEKALEVYPLLIDAQLGLADTLRQMEDWPAAIEAYEQLLELDPSRVDGLQEALLEYGGRLEEEGQIEQAIQQYERAAQLVANPRVQARLERTVRSFGRMLIQQERFDEALSLLERLGYEDEVERVDKERLRVWSKIEAQVADLTRRIEQPEWEKAYVLIQQYQQLNPADENAKQLRDEIRHQERRWNDEQGDAHMAVGQLEEAIAFFRKAGNKEGTKEASQKKKVLDMQEQAPEVGWKPLFDAASDYLGKYPDDSEISQLMIRAEQEYRREADRLLAQKDFEEAVSAYQDLGNKDKAIAALLAQWRDQMSKSARNRLVRFAALLGVSGAIVFCLVNIELSSLYHNLLVVTGSITFLPTVYLLCLLLFSDLLMRWRLQRRLERQLESIALPIGEAKRRIHNTEYIRPIPGSALFWGVIFGAIGWAILIGIPGLGFSLSDTLISFLVSGLVGIGAAMWSFEPKEDSKPSTISDKGDGKPLVLEKAEGNEFYFALPLLGALVPSVLMFALERWASQYINSVRIVMWVATALLALCLLGVANAWSLAKIRRIMKREIDFEKEE